MTLLHRLRSALALLPTLLTLWRCLRFEVPDGLRVIVSMEAGQPCVIATVKKCCAVGQLAFLPGTRQGTIDNYLIMKCFEVSNEFELTHAEAADLAFAGEAADEPGLDGELDIGEITLRVPEREPRKFRLDCGAEGGDGR